MSNKKKLIPALRFPEFKEDGEWEEKKLGEVLLSTSSNLALNKLVLKLKGKPVYGADGIVGYIDEFQHPEEYISVVKDGSGVGRLNFCIAQSSILGTLTCLKSSNKDRYNLKWIYFLLQTVDFSTFVKGSGIPHIYYADYKNELLPVPYMPEQQKIADCLSSLDDLLAAHNEKLELLKGHKKGLMQNLFPQEGETVPKVRFPDFEEDGEWELKPFSKFIKLYRGSSPRPIREYLTKEETGVNWIKIGDTSSITDFVIRSVSEKITPKGAEKSRRVKKGELILANSMSYGSTYLLEVEGCIYDGWFVLREYEEHFDKQFLLQLLNSEYTQGQYKRFAAGGIVQNISSEIVYSITLSKTSKEEQQKIASCLSAVDELIIAQQEKIDELQQHKKGLMQGLFPKMEN